MKLYLNMIINADPKRDDMYLTFVLLLIMHTEITHYMHVCMYVCMYEWQSTFFHVIPQGGGSELYRPLTAYSISPSSFEKGILQFDLAIWSPHPRDHMMRVVRSMVF